MQFSDKLPAMMEGFLKIIDDTNPNKPIILCQKKNAINFENMSITIGKALADDPEGHIHEMLFGNGGSTVSGTGQITYFPPNVATAASTLYNTTFSKVIDANSPLNTDPARNNIEIKHISGVIYTDITITSTLDFNEPAGQAAFDSASNTETNFIFDEIGLRAFNVVPGKGPVLTHVVFSPIQKSLNRRIKIQYTIRVQMC